MNIIPFSTDVNYTPPDIDLIKLSIGPMLKLAADAEFAFNETRYLPSMYAKAQGLYTLVVHAQGKIDEHIYTLETVTGNALTSLHRYRAEQIDDTPEEKHSLNAYARAQTITTFKKNATEATLEIRAQFKNLFGVVFDPALSTSYMDGLATEQTPLSSQMTSLEQQMTGLQDSRKIINDAMAVLEKGNFADIAKDALLTAENISAVGAAAPEVELIRLAMEHMRKTLEHAGQAISYLTLYEQREKLIGKIDALKPKLADCADQLKTINHKIKLIVSIHGLFERFFSARAEYAKVDQSVTAFFNHLALASEAEYEDRLVAAAPSFIAYLKRAH